MIQRDYNGTGKWAVSAVQARYADYAASLGVECPLQLLPKETLIYSLQTGTIGGLKCLMV